MSISLRIPAKRHWWWIVLLGISFVLVGALIYDRLNTILWDGGTELEIVFVVRDSVTGEPIECVELFVHSYWHSEPHEFFVYTEANGIAKINRPVSTGGRESGLRLTNTWSASIPDWYILLRHPDFQSSDWIIMTEITSSQEIQRRKGQKPKLVVNLTMQRAVNATDRRNP